jgi:NADH pyrophosphatase NudC (nudix superfamily)
LYRYCPFCRAHLEDREIDAAARRACPACDFVEWGNPTPTAMVLVRCGERCLFIRQPFFPPDLWGLVNGFVERGETAEQAAVREVKEEVGLDVRLATMAGTFYFERKNLLLVGFVADSDTMEVKPSEEISEWQWATRDEVKSLRLGDSVRAIARVATQ